MSHEPRPTPAAAPYGLPARILTAVLIATALAAGRARAQVPDTLRADTARVDTLRADSIQAPRYEVGALTVSVARLGTTTGGSSAVRLSLDSLPAPPAPTLDQVLEEMPLVQIRQNSRGQSQPALRGSEDRQVAVLMDGVPLTLGWDHRTDLSIVPLSAARSVTLIRGLSSVLHGPNVLGGVVEVDVGRGSAEIAPPRPLVVEASLDHVGGRGASVTGGEAMDGWGGRWVVRGGVGYQERPGQTLPDGLDAGEGQRPELVEGPGGLRLNSDVRRADGFLSTRYLAGSGQWFSLSASGLRSERGVPPEIHVDEPRLWRYPSEDRVIAALSGGTGHHPTPFGGVGDLEASVGIDLGETSIDAYSTPEYDEVTGGELGEDRTLTLRLLGDHTLGPDLDLRGALTYADVHHGEVLDDAGPADYRQRLWSAGAEVDWSIGRGTRLDVGAAIDGADTPETGDKPALGRLSEWAARVGVSSLLSDDDVRIHGAASRRARFPALRELYSGALGRFVPNPDLRPELLLGAEAGATLQLDAAEVQAVVFHQRLEDGIVRTTATEDGVSRFQRVNQDEIRSTGLEVLASGPAGPLTLSGDITLQHVRGYDAEGREVLLEYEPSVAGRLGVGAPLPWDLTAAAEIRHMSDQHCQNPEAGGLEPFDTDPSLDVDLRRTVRTGESGLLSRAEVVVALDNVTDAAIFDQCGLPRAGRTLGLKVRFWGGR